jgi:hypothetical protein
MVPQPTLAGHVSSHLDVSGGCAHRGPGGRPSLSWGHRKAAPLCRRVSNRNKQMVSITSSPRHVRRERAAATQVQVLVRFRHAQTMALLAAVVRTYREPSRYDQFVSRFVPGRTNRVRALEEPKSGPRYGAPGRKIREKRNCFIHTIGPHLVDNCFKWRAVRHHARASHCAWRFAPRLGAAIGAWGLRPVCTGLRPGKDEPVVLGERAPGVSAAAATSEAAFAAGRANRERARLALQRAT